MHHVPCSPTVFGVNAAFIAKLVQPQMAYLVPLFRFLSMFARMGSSPPRLTKRTNQVGSSTDLSYPHRLCTHARHGHIRPRSGLDAFLSCPNDFSSLIGRRALRRPSHKGFSLGSWAPTQKGNESPIRLDMDSNQCLGLLCSLGM